MGTRFDNRTTKEIGLITSVQSSTQTGVTPGPTFEFDPNNQEDPSLHTEKQFLDPNEDGGPSIGEPIDDERIEWVPHYETPKFPDLTSEDRYSLINEHHIWTVGDRYWKLSTKFYGSSDLWWVIAWYNQKPTDAHVKIGDSIAIPMPIDKVLGLFYG
jgi:hypothetical protein